MPRQSKHGISKAEFDQRRKEFCARGQTMNTAKLMDLDVISIRSAKRQRESLRKHINENLSNAALARIYGVTERTIEDVLNRSTWNHLA